MTLFKRGLTTGTNDVKDSEAIGLADNKVGMGDLGKLVKLSAASFVLCADGDHIDGQIDSFREFTVNEGFPFGTVKKGFRLGVAVAAANTAVIGSRVVAAAQAALGDTDGLADPYGKGLVNIDATSPSVSKWRIYEILGDATKVNCKVIIERD